MSQRILVIDFAPRSLESVRALLAEAGHDVRTASNGSEVDAALANPEYGFVVLEPVLPGRDGFELCRSIKESGSSAPLVLLASRIFKGSRFKKMSGACRADGHFERPNEDHELLAAIERLAPHAPVHARPAPTSSDEAAVSIGLGPDDVGELSLDPNDDFHEIEDDAGMPRVEEPISMPEAPSGPLTAEPTPQPSPQPTQVAASAAAAAAQSAADDTVLAALEAEDSLAGLSDISENDIDEAWSRLVESSSGGSKSASPAAPPSGGPAVATPSPSPVDREELGGAVDRALSGLSLGGELDGSSWSERPTEAAPSLRTASETSSTVADASVRAPRPAQAAVAEARPAEDSIDLPLDLEAASSGAVDDEQTVPSGPASEALEEEPSVESVSTAFSESGLEEVLDSALDGLLATGHPDQRDAAAAPSDEAAASAPQAQAPPPPREIPEGLRGMDASTADLLSSLADLESSIPDGPKPSDASANELPASALDEIADIPMATATSPSSEDELTLEEIFTRVSEPVGDADEPAPAAPAPPEPNPPSGPRLAAPSGASAASADAVFQHEPDAEPPAIAPEDAPAPPEGESGDGTRKQSWRKWLLGSVSVAALMAVAVAAIALFAVPELGERALPRLASAVGLDRPAVIPASAEIASTEAAPAPAIEEDGAGEPVELARSDSAPASDGGTASEWPRAAAAEAEAKPTSTAPASPPAEQLAQTRRPVPPVVQRPEPAAARDTREARTRRDAPSEAGLASEPRASGEPRVPSPNEAAQVLRRSRGLASAGAETDDQKTERDTSPRDLVEAARRAETTVRLVRLGDLDEPLHRVVTVPAQLTEEAETAGVADKAFVNVLVGPDGGVLEVKLVMDPGYGLGDAAVEAVEQWHYSAPRYEGRPVQVWKTEPVAFERRAEAR